MREALAEPRALTEAILDLRAYERAYREVEAAENPYTLPPVGLIPLVMEYRKRLTRERLQRRGRAMPAEG